MEVITIKDAIEHKNEERFRFRANPGLSEEVIRKISESKKEPEWMLQKRLQAFKIFQELKMPDWGPDLSALDFNKIVFYQEPDAEQSKSWEDVPADIRKTFELLGIPEAEKKYLGGVGAQYESNVVYHNLQKDLQEKGVIFEDFDVAVQKYPKLVKKYFMSQCVSPRLHKFAALHGAVFSGGTFIYVPKNVKVMMPLQAYFRMNAKRGGQFEHTLIIIDEGAECTYIEGCSAPQYTENSLHAGCVEIFVHKNARARYSSVENWSKNTFNLNTKRAIVDENAFMEWINGNMGSCVTMLYPCTVLRGKNSKVDHIGIAFAGKGQFQDVGAKVYHVAANTSSTIISKSISKDGGITVYRGLVKIPKGSKNVKSSVKCDALMMDNISKSDTIPYIEVNEKDAHLAHEATVGKISKQQLFYLMSRGLDEEQATQMIVSGFIEPITKELPLEYAVELNRLIELEMEGSLG
ncbi:MAG: Fe-S cluster assembly protein SufB [Candidatus Woesearchaeota archaeon]